MRKQPAFSTESDVKSIDKFEKSGDKSVSLYQSFEEIALLIKSDIPAILFNISIVQVNILYHICAYDIDLITHPASTKDDH